MLRTVQPHLTPSHTKVSLSNTTTNVHYIKNISSSHLIFFLLFLLLHSILTKYIITSFKKLYIFLCYPNMIFNMGYSNNAFFIQSHYTFLLYVYIHPFQNILQGSYISVYHFLNFSYVITLLLCLVPL